MGRDVFGVREFLSVRAKVGSRGLPVIVQSGRQETEAHGLSTVGVVLSASCGDAVPNYSNGTISNATMLMILISGFTAGPAVSLYGSPTVSPVTAALCASEPLPP